MNESASLIIVRISRTQTSLYQSSQEAYFEVEVESVVLGSLRSAISVYLAVDILLTSDIISAFLIVFLVFY